MSAQRRLLHLALLGLALLSGCAWPPPGPPTDVRPGPRLDVVWVPSAPEVIQAMLEAAAVGPGDVVYDLGCGDGEILIAAATHHGARGVGVDLDPERIHNARRNAARAGVTDRVTFFERDLFTTDIGPATVVTLYLSPEVNARLRPKLLRELRPGARIVSHDFGMGDWAPERTIEVMLARVHRVFLWRVPAAARFSLATTSPPSGTVRATTAHPAERLRRSERVGRIVGTRAGRIFRDRSALCSVARAWASLGKRARGVRGGAREGQGERPAGPRGAGRHGVMFWLRRKRLSGSHRRFTATSRSKLCR